VSLTISIHTCNMLRKPVKQTVIFKISNAKKGGSCSLNLGGFASSRSCQYALEEGKERRDLQHQLRLCIEAQVVSKLHPGSYRWIQHLGTEALKLLL